MIILGLHNSFDSGVCLLKDGKLLEAVSEERFNRIKLFDGPPDKSLKYILDKYKLSLNDIDYFAYGMERRQIILNTSNALHQG